MDQVQSKAMDRPGCNLVEGEVVLYLGRRQGATPGS